MADKFLHEALYRGQAALDRLGQAHITICGAGALGSHLIDTLARQGARRLTVIDQDRAEEHNIGTQIYDEGDIGAFKAEVMQARCFRATGIELEAVAKLLTERNIAKLLRGASLVIDTFDNSASRRLVAEHCNMQGLACLHLGMNADYGEVKWNESYRVPGDVLEGNACEYPLARNLILIIVALGSEAALRFLLDGQKESYSFTLRDLSVNREP
jgi:molybdopterin/thiamine biosynthesis adenylyltransferase